MRNKRSRKLISILITLTMLVTLLVPMVGPASASTSYSMTSVNKIKAPFGAPTVPSAIGNLTITMDGASVIASAYKYVIFDLPTSPSGYVIDATSGNFTATNGLQGYITLSRVNDTEFKLSVDKLVGGKNVSDISNAGVSFDPSKDTLISIPLKMYVPGGVSGEVKLTASAPSSSTFTSGTITVAKVGVSSVTLASESVPTITSSGTNNFGTIDIKEDTMGALLNSGSMGTTIEDPATHEKTTTVASDGNYALKLTLPPGFKWSLNAKAATLMWGDPNLTGETGATHNPSLSATSNTVVNALNNGFKYSNDNRELDINVPTVNGFDNNGYAIGSSTASFIKLAGGISIDDSTAKAGDVTVTVTGSVSASPTSFVIAKYGDFSTSIKAFSAVDVVAGKSAVDIGKFEIDEAVPGSILGNRTVTLTLPDNVRWSQLPTLDSDNSSNYGTLAVGWQIVGSDAKMIKGTFTDKGTTSGQTDAAKVVFKNMQVTTAIDYTGDIKATIAGSEGLTGELVLGTAKAAVSVKASSTPDVKLGVSSQAIGDITVTENMAGAIDGTITYSKSDPVSYLLTSNTTSGSGNSMLTLEAPAGVTFDGTPTVEVTDGDMQITANGVSTDTTSANEGLLYIKIKSSSTKASTLKISNIKLTINRTIPEGALKLELKGNAINETLTDSGADTYFPGRTSAATVAVATCVTPASTETKSTTVFKIGDTKYTVNGAESTLDAAPYIKNDRTFLPIRFVAKAVGVSDNNIMWNADEQSVVMVKGDRVVKLVIGSTNMLINGVAVTMDSAPEVVDPGRTMLPVRWVAQALGADIQWDAATQTVTIN